MTTRRDDGQMANLRPSHDEDSCSKVLTLDAMVGCVNQSVTG